MLLLEMKTVVTMKKRTYKTLSWLSVLSYCYRLSATELNISYYQTALLAERELQSDRLSDHELDITQSLFNEAERELVLEPRLCAVLFAYCD